MNSVPVSEIPKKRREPIVGFLKFDNTSDFERWQEECPDYTVFSTMFLVLNGAVVICVTCGNVQEFSDRNDEIDALTKAALANAMKKNDDDPNIVTHPPATSH